jgi:hypothetical protein
VTFQIFGDYLSQNITQKKPIEPTTSLIQFLILLELEKHKKLTIRKITELLGHENEEYISIEANYLIYHPVNNKTKDSKSGIILSNQEDKKDLTPDNEIMLNENFNPVNIKLNSAPLTLRFKLSVDIIFKLANG